jgi:hypothetical protein
MAYKIDQTSGDIIIGGFEQGIGASPYSGLTDMRSVDPTGLPGEASISYATAPIFKNPQLINNTTGSLITTSTGEFLAPSSLLLETGQYVTLSNLGGASGTVATGVTYILSHVGLSGANNVWQLYTLANVLATVTGASTSAVTFSTLNPSQPNYMVFDGNYHWMLDNNGYLWSDIVTTTGGGLTPATHSWTWTQNNVTSAHGNGLATLRTPNTGGTGDTWIFIFRDNTIDYGPVVTTAYPVWVNGWNPNTGTANNGTVIQYTLYHQAMVAPDGNLYFLNSSASAQHAGSIGKLQVNFSNSSFTAFVPLNGTGPSVSNYSYTDYPLIPKYDFAKCLAPSGTNILIGGQQNYIYNWDTFSTVVAGYIYLAEKNTVTMVTVNQNTYAFTGNRGNIYITNGSQADVWKKMPDHLTGIVYPVWNFYGATYQKGRLYFGVSATAQTVGGYLPIGGVWCIDLATGALRCSNQLSYGNYNGYATCFLQGDVTTNTPPGSGLYIGWSDGTGNLFGVDSGIPTPYTNGASYIVSDLIPVGTSLNPTTALQIEFKLAMPLVSGETVDLQMASSLYDYVNNSFTDVGTITGTNSPYTTPDGTNPPILSGNLPATVQRQQWLLVKAILTSTVTNPSFNRITEIRVIGGTVKDNVATAPYGTK